MYGNCSLCRNEHACCCAAVWSPLWSTQLHSKRFFLIHFMGAQIMQGERGVVAHVTLPHAHTLEQYDKLELDFTLGCPGELSASL